MGLYVVGREGQYLVSNDGNVSNARTGYTLKQSTDKDGYKVVMFSNPKEQKKVHRLVAEAFIPNPMRHPLVNHKDHIRHHNWNTNLEWGTQLHNIQHCVAAGRKAKVPGRKILARLGDHVEIFESVKAAQRAKHNRAAIQRCLAGDQRYHHNRTWEYA